MNQQRDITNRVRLVHLVDRVLNTQANKCRAEIFYYKMLKWIKNSKNGYSEFHAQWRSSD